LANFGDITNMKVEKGLSILPHCKQSVAIFGDLKKKKISLLDQFFILSFSLPKTGNL
jgi:hypothetical protein